MGVCSDYNESVLLDGFLVFPNVLPGYHRDFEGVGRAHDRVKRGELMPLSLWVKN